MTRTLQSPGFDCRMLVQHALYAIQHEPQLFGLGFYSQRESLVDK